MLLNKSYTTHQYILKVIAMNLSKTTFSILSIIVGLIIILAFLVFAYKFSDSSESDTKNTQLEAKSSKIGKENTDIVEPRRFVSPAEKELKNKAPTDIRDKLPAEDTEKDETQENKVVNPEEDAKNTHSTDQTGKAGDKKEEISSKSTMLEKEKIADSVEEVEPKEKESNTNKVDDPKSADPKELISKNKAPKESDVTEGDKKEISSIKSTKKEGDKVEAIEKTSEIKEPSSTQASPEDQKESASMMIEKPLADGKADAKKEHTSVCEEKQTDNKDSDKAKTKEVNPVKDAVQLQIDKAKEMIKLIEAQE